MAKAATLDVLLAAVRAGEISLNAARDAVREARVAEVSSVLAWQRAIRDLEEHVAGMITAAPITQIMSAFVGEDRVL